MLQQINRDEVPEFILRGMPTTPAFDRAMYYRENELDAVRFWTAITIVKADGGIVRENHHNAIGATLDTLKQGDIVVSWHYGGDVFEDTLHAVIMIYEA